MVNSNAGYNRAIAMQSGNAPMSMVADNSCAAWCASLLAPAKDSTVLAARFRTLAGGSSPTLLLVRSDSCRLHGVELQTNSASIRISILSVLESVARSANSTGMLLVDLPSSWWGQQQRWMDASLSLLRRVAGKRYAISTFSDGILGRLA